MEQRLSHKTRHLGRGLESLLGPAPTEYDIQSPGRDMLGPQLAEASASESIQNIPVGLISPNPHQARTHWDEAKLKELADSIKANGLVQPIVVRRVDRGFQIIAGERRFRASKILGLASVPAYVRGATDAQMLELALVENIHRSDLNAIERATAYKAYLARFSLTQAQAAERLGEDRSVISNHLRLLDLPPEVQEMLIDGRLSMGHARAILGLPTDDLRIGLAHRAVSGHMSVRDVEKSVAEHCSQGPVPATGPQPSPMGQHIAEIETRLSAQMGTRVRIQTKRNGRSGRLTIEFKSIEDFDRVLERLGVRYSEEL